MVGYQHGRKHPVRGEGDAAIEGVTYRARILVCCLCGRHTPRVNLRRLCSEGLIHATARTNTGGMPHTGLQASLSAKLCIAEYPQKYTGYDPSLNGRESYLAWLFYEVV